MSVPTEDGPYWVSFNEGTQVADRIVSLWTFGGERGVTCFGGEPLTDWAFDAFCRMVAKWGPRIPAPERLEALERLAKHNPVIDHGGLGYLWCSVCKAATELRGQDLVHAPDCPWLLAQEAKP